MLHYTHRQKFTEECIGSSNRNCTFHREILAPFISVSPWLEKDNLYLIFWAYSSNACDFTIHLFFNFFKFPNGTISLNTKLIQGYIKGSWYQITTVTFKICTYFVRLSALPPHALSRWVKPRLLCTNWTREEKNQYSYTAALFRNSGKQNSPENDMLVQIQNVDGQWKEYILSKTHRNWAIQSRSDF